MIDFGSRKLSLRARGAVRATMLFVAVCGVASAGLVAETALPAGAPQLHIVIHVGSHNALPNGTVGKVYAAQFHTAGGLAPIHWKIASGKLPAGLKFNASTAKITGKPTTKGHYNFVVQASDSAHPPHTARLTASITIK